MDLPMQVAMNTGNSMRVFLLHLFFFCFAMCVAQGNMHTVMFYNVENYFDCLDDSLTSDADFLPDAPKHWNWKRYTTKRQNIARVIAAVGKGVPPVLVGLCEVENAMVLHQLVAYKPLSTYGYKTVHYESPDARGIDVALLYQPRIFTPIVSNPIPVQFADGTHSRDILYVKGLMANADTLHVMVCHAPSRRGGSKADLRRRYAMQLVRHVVDSVLAVTPQASMLIMGDFNDTPLDASIRSTLGAVPVADKDDAAVLYNIMPTHQGTYKYKGEWSLFDQFMVTPALLQSDGFCVGAGLGCVFSEAFLLENDKTYMGVKPFRTYLGPRYVGGYSDHLPIYFRLQQLPRKN